MPPSPELAIVMPVYNEEGAIAAVLEKWSGHLNDLKINYQIHAYNDGSRDRTLEILKTAAAQNRAVVVHDKTNSGHGPTILQGYRENSGANWIFQIDSDDELGPESFATLWQARERYDFLIGVRRGRRSPLPRKIISFVSRLAVRVFFGRSAWDVNCPYRLMRSDKFRELFPKIPENTFAPNVIVTGFAARQGLRTFETPVRYRDRQTGVVSIRKWKLLKAAFKSFRQTIDFALTFHS